MKTRVQHCELRAPPLVAFGAGLPGQVELPVYLET